MSVNEKWVVLKFGGSSVSSVERWETIARIIKKRLDEGLRPLVVCSAFAGISDKLERMIADIIDTRPADVLGEVETRHREIAKELGVKFDELRTHFDELGKLTTGVSLTGEVSPRLHAQIMSFGELLSTKMGTAYLNANGVRTAWHDARDYLLALEGRGVSAKRDYLHAACDCSVDENLRRKLAGENLPVILTQGFVARNSSGDTVLLGRGGSDVSGAYFAAKLGAERLEIWTDVPGMYTAHPQKVTSARLLKVLDYDEAQEIASSGAKVLHPRCIVPVRKSNIPLHVKCMSHPEVEGTIVSSAAVDAGPQVKGISSKNGIALISMETMDMWHQAGFLAKAFDCFKQHGLSIDLVSTSESNVTVTLDWKINALDETALKALVRDLESFCQVRVIQPSAMVSLVGKNIRSILHKLGPVLELFEEQKIYLLSQAANDLNLTFVVDEEQADRLVMQLHAEIFGQRKHDKLLGPTWQELFEKEEEKTRTSPWWHRRKDELIGLARENSPTYVYHGETIDQKLSQLKELSAVDRVFYSIKANPHVEIMKRVEGAGFGFECVSIDEVEHVLKHFPKIDPKRILFTPNFAAREEYERALKLGIHVTLDNLHPLERWPELFKGREVLVRMDPGRGKGHHKYVHTAGTKSKFGVPSTQIDEFARLAKRAGAKVVGLHAHVGSNIFDTATWSEAAVYLAKVAEKFPDVRYLDLGGGLGVVEKPGHDALDIESVNQHLMKIREAHPEFELWIEPGRFVAAESGVLLALVTQTKQKGEYHYVGINTGMNTLIRPALYGSFHEIVNLSRLDEEANTVANIVGPICESGDILGYSRHIAQPQEGDVILIATTGAYGRVMSSSYNLRPPAAEYFLK